VEADTDKAIDDEIPKPAAELVRRILQAGVGAGRAAAEAGQRVTASGVASYAKTVLRGDETESEMEALLDRIVRAHVMLARGEGAAAGAATSIAEVTTIVGTGGTLTVPTVLAITATDLTGLLWIQLRMVLTIAALHGHDPRSPERIKEFFALQGSSPAAGVKVASVPLAAGAQRVGTRLANRYLRGPILVSITSMFRAVGIRFSRAALLRQLFIVNIPINAAMNDVTTRKVARAARGYYRTLPAGLGSDE